MERETRYGLDGTTVYTWATDPKSATVEAATFTGIPRMLLDARATGLTRPGGYELDDITEGTSTTGDSYRRYAVKGKATK